MNGHKYSRLLGIKRNPTDYKTKIFQRLVYARIIRKSIRITASGHKRGNLLDKLSDWIQYVTGLEKKRQKNAALAKKLERQRSLADARNQTQQKRESKDIRTKSKSSNSPNGDMNIKGGGKVKLKIKVDPSRYRDTPNSSSPMHINNSRVDRTQYLSSPLLQSALMSSTTRNSDSMLTNQTTSESTFSEKLFNCEHCTKQFSIRSSFLRHVRAQHGIDTRSQQFLQHLKHQTTYPSSIPRQEMGSCKSSLQKRALEPSRVNSSNFTSSRKLHSKDKGVRSDGYGKFTSNRKRKIQETVECDSIVSTSHPSFSNSGKKIKLSLKLGKGIRKGNNDSLYNKKKNDLPSSNVVIGDNSSFQELSPATSPASKVCNEIYRVLSRFFSSNIFWDWGRRMYLC